MSAISILGFSGAFLDPVTGTVPLGNGYRWYLPALMRFNAADSFSPFGPAGINPYAYCSDDPIDYIDPRGHMEVNLGGELSTLESSSLRDAEGDSAEMVHESGTASDGAGQSGPIATGQSRTGNQGPGTSMNRPTVPGVQRAGQVPGANLPEWRTPNAEVRAWRRPGEQPPLFRKAAPKKTSAPPRGTWRERRIAAGQRLLINPPPYNDNPIFAELPEHAWSRADYQVTLSVRWVTYLGDTGLGTVTSHIHYRWTGTEWEKFGGNTWITGVKDFDWPTPDAVVDMAPALPRYPDYHP
ncbi:RHS repeat-associated core domain-containing protein [Trinickia sp.]|uniref:RHS repeat-associated core domain-containing protein n=1 Tax=Trinickia sp. TaxID=2571163 RepID=UPI003F7F2489